MHEQSISVNPLEKNSFTDPITTGIRFRLYMDEWRIPNKILFL